MKTEDQIKEELGLPYSFYFGRKELQDCFLGIGEFTDGKNIGKATQTDFDPCHMEIDKSIVVSCGDGVSWRGTFKEFCKKWKRVS